MVFQFCSKKTVALLLLALSARDKFRLFLIGIIQKRIQIVQSQGEISDMSIYNLKFNGFLRMNKFINWIMRYKFVDIFRIQNKCLNMGCKSCFNFHGVHPGWRKEVGDTV